MKKMFLTLLLLFLVIVLKNSNVLDKVKNDLGVLNEKIVVNLETSQDIISEDSSIANNHEVVSFNADPLYHRYYFLLNDSQKSLYQEVYQNALDLKTTFVPKKDIYTSDIQQAVEAVYNDHPEIFWLDTQFTYKYREDNKCVELTIKFNDTVANLEISKNAFEKATNDIISEASKLKSDYEKEKYVHDTIINNVEYVENAPMNQSAYSALVLKKSVCAGYARAFQYIMNELSIPTYFVVGYAKEDHGWNIVKLDDGYYNVDLTWDDSSLNCYEYFNKTDAEFNLTHRRIGLSMYLPSCNAYKYNLANNQIVYYEPSTKDLEESSFYVLELID